MEIISRPLEIPLKTDLIFSPTGLTEYSKNLYNKYFPLVKTGIVDYPNYLRVLGALR